MKIGKTEITGFCALAPMAGVSDSAFRELCTFYGSGFNTTEMVSAKALTMGDKKSIELMTVGCNERPCGIQLFGHIPEILAEGAKMALEFSPDFIDINMGCPAPKIVKNGSGSALLKDPLLVGKIVYAVKNSVDIPVSVKIRSGWDKNSLNYLEIARQIENNGADFITVHAKIREQMYAPPADLNVIRDIKNELRIPVIGNGDIFTPEDAKTMYEYTNCDYLMVGRGTLGRPWIIKQINEYLSTGEYSPSPANEEKMDIMLSHAERICELKGERIGINEIRKHALWYTKGIYGSAKLRNEFSTVKSFDELKLLAEKVCEIG